MSTDQILALLVAERDRLNRAIEALQGPIKRRGRPPANKVVEMAAPATAAPTASAPKRRKRTPAQKKAQAERMRAYWAARKRAEKR